MFCGTWSAAWMILSEDWSLGRHEQSQMDKRQWKKASFPTRELSILHSFQLVHVLQLPKKPPPVVPGTDLCYRNTILLHFVQSGKPYGSSLFLAISPYRVRSWTVFIIFLEKMVCFKPKRGIGMWEKVMWRRWQSLCFLWIPRSLLSFGSRRMSMTTQQTFLGMDPGF